MKYLCVLFLCVLVSCKTKKTVKPESKPNIIYINVDDLGWMDTETYGSTFYETPNITRLAKSGMLFTNGYASAANCAPSRACLISGQNTPRHGIYTVSNSDRGNEKTRKIIPIKNTEVLADENVTIAEMLKKAGYTTGTFGKWHLGDDPKTQGFDVNVAGANNGNPGKNGFFSPYNVKNIVDNKKGENLTDRLTQEAISFIKDNKEQPFFLYLPYYAVHTPLSTTNALEEKYKEKGGNSFQNKAVYAGMIETVDRNIGLILDEIEALNLKNTLIVFTSDNGGVTSGDNFSTNQLSLRGGKGYQWEGGIRIPYFIDVPWLKQSGANINVPVSGVDLFPTLLDLSGLPLKPEAHKDGVSLKPLLLGENIDERPLYWHYPHYGNQGGEPSSIIRKGKWKLICYWEDNHAELYNLDADLGERTDVAESNPEIATQMKTQLLDWLESMGTHYATKDALWDKASRKIWLGNQKTKRLPSLEKQRKQMLSPDWKPNKDWWGSEVETK